MRRPLPWHIGFALVASPSAALVAYATGWFLAVLTH